MARFLSTLLLIATALFLLLLLVSNRQEALLSLDPTSVDDPALSLGPLPVAAHVVAGLALGFVLGALGMYLSGAKRRAELRDARRENRRLAEELREARADAYRRQETVPAAALPMAQADASQKALPASG